MIDCSDLDNEKFICFYERENGKILFYTKDNEYVLEDNLDNLIKIRNIMNAQACVNATYSKKRVKELLFGSLLLPYLSFMLCSSFDVFNDNTTFNIIFFALCVSAFVSDMYYVVSRGVMSSECIKDKYYIENIDYINYHINDDSIKDLFSGLDDFKDTNGKIYLDMNDVDLMKCSDLIKLRTLIDETNKEKIKKR